MKAIISRHFDFINGLLAVRYKTLLIALVAMVILPKFLYESDYQRFVSTVLNAIVVLLTIYAIQESRRELYIGTGIAIVVIMINQVGVFKDSATIDFYLSFIIYIIFYIHAVYRFLIKIIRTDNVKVGVLYAAVIVYLFIGIIGGYLFMLIENLNPGSLNNLEITNITSPSRFFYFSFTTLSTLGYGDIVPISPPAQALSMVLSTTGPLYLTILVALLVSRFEHSDIH